MKMESFNLISIDWNSVQLLHGDHLAAETAYLEECLRWILHSSGVSGVVQMVDDSLWVSSSATDYEVILHSCRAITPRGYLVEVSELNRPAPLHGENSALTQPIVPIYLEVQNRQSVATTPAKSAPLLECRGLQWSYALVTSPSARAIDYIQIGQMRKEGTRFVHDTLYIPECIHLDSHPALVKKIQSLLNTAQGVVEQMNRYARTGFGVSHLTAASIAAALSPIAIVADWRAYPRAWIERAAQALGAVYALIQPLSSQQLSSWVLAKDPLEDCVRRLMEAPLPLWDALDRIEQALRALLPLGQELREPVQTFTPHEPVPPEHSRIKEVSPRPIKEVPPQSTVGGEPRPGGMRVIRCPHCRTTHVIRPGEPELEFCRQCGQRLR